MQERRYTGFIRFKPTTNARPDLARVRYSHPLRPGATHFAAVARNRWAKGRRLYWGPIGPKLRRPPKLPNSANPVIFRPELIVPAPVQRGVKMRPIVLARSIAPAVAGVTPDAICGRSRKAPTAFSRQVLCYVLARGYMTAYAEIGRRLGLDHATAIHAVKKIQRMVASGAIADPIPYVMGRAA